MQYSNATIPINFEISCQSHNTQINLNKAKQNSSSNRKNEYASQHLKTKQILPSKSKSHTRQNSNLRKSKSKCDTQTNFSGKNKKAQNESISKKTIPKKKKDLNGKNKCSFETNRISSSKLSSSVLKSSQKKKKGEKPIFHSTCFSRNYELQNINTGVLSPGASDIIQLVDKNIEISDKDIMMEKIFEKTRNVLGKYKKKCDILDKNCQYYQSELNKALKELNEYKKKEMRRQANQKIESNEYRKGFSQSKKETRKSRAKTNHTKKSKSSNHREYGYHRNDSEIFC